MAKGRSLDGVCSPEEFYQILQVIETKFTVYGFQSDTGPNHGESEYSLSEWSIYGDDLAFTRWLHLRLSPLDKSISYKYYWQNTIQEGFVFINSAIYTGHRFKLFSATVGSAPPREGIENPMPLFNLLRREIKKICVHVAPNDMFLKSHNREKFSDGAMKLFEQGYKLRI